VARPGRGRRRSCSSPCPRGLGLGPCPPRRLHRNRYPVIPEDLLVAPLRRGGPHLGRDRAAAADALSTAAPSDPSWRSPSAVSGVHRAHRPRAHAGGAGPHRPQDDGAAALRATSSTRSWMACAPSPATTISSALLIQDGSDADGCSSSPPSRSPGSRGRVAASGCAFLSTPEVREISSAAARSSASSAKERCGGSGGAGR
jgi:hypothetical protein